LPAIYAAEHPCPRRSPCPRVHPCPRDFHYELSLLCSWVLHCSFLLVLLPLGVVQTMGILGFCILLHLLPLLLLQKHAAALGLVLVLLAVAFGTGGRSASAFCASLGTRDCITVGRHRSRWQPGCACSERCINIPISKTTN